MSTGYETFLGVVEARLKAAPTNWGLGVQEFKRTHLTAVPAEKVNAVHLIDGADELDAKSKCGARIGAFRVSLFLRGDDVTARADALKVEVNRRLNPRTAAYGGGILLKPGRIVVDNEIADKDSTRIDMEFAFQYPTEGGDEWSL